MSHSWISQQIHPVYAHKVWILDCKNCGMFLTNRGMKAVLLLRPNVSLYSSDALPVNCSPYSSNPNVLWSPTAYKSSLSHIPPRTCECLTQSLFCHGCGGNVGYMIVIPCSRCTSSISATNRSTNGHRFVFQSSEVLGTERHYISNEKGVMPFDTTAIDTVPLLQPYTYPAPQLNLYHVDNHDSAADSYGQESRVDSLPTSSPEFTNILDYSEQQLSEHDSWAYSGRPSRMYRSPLQARTSHSPIPVHLHYHSLNSTDSSTDIRSQPLLVNPNLSFTADQKYVPATPPVLKAGDVIFWHHLAMSGEILGVVDDERARRPTGESAGGGMNFDR